MAKRNRLMWLGVNTDEMLGLLRGNYKMELPIDAEIVQMRSGEMFNVVEFLINSKEYPELTMGMVIPTEQKCLITKEEGKIL